MRNDIDKTMHKRTDLNHGIVLGLLGVRVVRSELGGYAGHLWLYHRLRILGLNEGLGVLRLYHRDLWWWLP